MKILHICLCGAMTDRLHYQENLLAKYHRKMGCDVTMIASQWMWGTDGRLKTTDRTDYRNEDGVKVIRLPIRRGTIESRLKVYPGLYQAVEKEEPDVLFIHGCQFLDILVLADYAKRHPAAAVYVDNHADHSNAARGWLSRNILHRGLWRYCARRIEPYVTKFYGVLPARVDFLRELYGLPAERCELLVMGADDELAERAGAPEVRERVRARYGIAEQDFLIMTGGKINRFRPETLDLMRAVLALGRRDVKLLVFGAVTDGLEAEFGRLCAQEPILYAGWLEAEETYDYLAAADLVVFPGLHSVLWEQAVAQGKPCIFRDMEGFRHVDLGGNAAFAADVSAAGLQRALAAVIDDPAKYRAMRSAAGERGMGAFSCREIARRSIRQAGPPGDGGRRAESRGDR